MHCMVNTELCRCAPACVASAQHKVQHKTPDAALVSAVNGTEIISTARSQADNGVTVLTLATVDASACYE